MSAPRAATLTASAATVDNQPIVSLGFVWVGDPEEGRAFLRKFHQVGTPVTERVHEMTYVGLQCMSDDPNVHGRRRYSKGHYLTELSDAAIAPFSNGVYVNALDNEGQDGVRRAYPAAKLARLAELKRRYDPDNAFHLNQNIEPATR